MSDPFIGQVTPFPYNFAPQGWLECNGQDLPVSGYAALYAVIGMTYGGTGTSTFKLPNLKSCVVAGAGQGSGLSNWGLGQARGNSQVVLSAATMPNHTHSVTVASSVPPAYTASVFENAFVGFRDQIGLLYSKETAPLSYMAGGAVGNAGGNAAHENRQPFVALRFCIAYEGVFPVPDDVNYLRGLYDDSPHIKRVK